MKAMKKKKKQRKEELRAFENMSVSDSDEESKIESSSKEWEIWKLGSDEDHNLTIKNQHSSTKLK